MFKEDLRYAFVENRAAIQASTHRADIVGLGIIPVSWRLKETEGREKKKKKMAQNRRKQTQGLGKMEGRSTWNPEKSEVVDTSLCQEAERSRLMDRLQQLRPAKRHLATWSTKSLKEHIENSWKSNVP